MHLYIGRIRTAAAARRWPDDVIETLARVLAADGTRVVFVSKGEDFSCAGTCVPLSTDSRYWFVFNESARSTLHLSKHWASRNPRGANDRTQWELMGPDGRATGVARALAVGDRVRLFGGYDSQPEWLGDRRDVFGVVERFVPGQNEQPAAVVRLDEELEVGETKGQVVVLELGWLGTDWATPEPRIHVELCDFDPEPRPRQERRHGAWIESHASYEVVPAA